MTGDPHTLTSRSFRIQFRAEADIAGGVCAGRIEHLRSGDAAHFSTIEELLSFVDFWLSRQHTRPARRRLPEREPAPARDTDKGFGRR
jgi:hypothetical protein